MSTHRRFRIAVHPTYDKEFDRRRMASVVINENAPKHISQAGSLQDKDFLGWLKVELEGSTKHPGEYWAPDANKYKQCILKSLNDALEAIQQTFELQKQTAINLGNEIPTALDAATEDKRLRFLAELDIRLEELDVINDRLKQLAEAELKSRPGEGKLLPRGPVGAGRLRDNILVEIDAQVVLPNDKGILCIASPDSPYYGMTCADYKGLIVKPWAWANTLAQRNRTKQNLELERQGLPIKQGLAKTPWPAWPEGVKKHVIKA